MMLKFKNFTLLFLFLLPPVAHAANVDGYIYTIRDDLQQALFLPIARFEVNPKDVLQFTSSFRRATGVALCLEIKQETPAPVVDVPVPAPLAIDTLAPLVLENTTPSAILDAFTLLRPDYTWLPVSGNRVNIIPTSYLNDPNWRGHHITGTWDALNVGVYDYLGKVIAFSLNTAQPLLSTSEVTRTQQLWANHPQLLGMRRETIRLRDATLLEALNALDAFGPDVVWTLNGAYYQCDTVNLDEVYPKALQEAEMYRKQNGAQPEAAIALYQMAFEEAPYAALKVRIGMAILDIYLGRSMVNATPKLNYAAQMCRVLLDAQPKYPYDATLWQEYITTLYKLGKERDAQWAVRAICPPGAAPDGYACVQAKQLTLWMATLYEKPEDRIEYLIGKQNVFPDDPNFNAELDALTLQLQSGMASEEAPEHNPYAQFNRPKPESEADANAETGDTDRDNSSSPRRRGVR